MAASTGPQTASMPGLPPGGHNPARPVREFRIRGADRAGNAIFSLLTRAGIGPAHC